MFFFFVFFLFFEFFIFRKRVSFLSTSSLFLSFDQTLLLLLFSSLPIVTTGVKALSIWMNDTVR